MHTITKVLKFGGTSVGTPESLVSVIEIIKDAYRETPHIAVVVSAFGGVTDQLIAMGNLAASHTEEWRSLLERLIERHTLACEAFELSSQATEKIEELFGDLSIHLEGIYLIRDLSLKTLDHLMSFGELLSARILSEALKLSIPKTQFVDARELIKTDDSFGGAYVDFNLTNANIQKRFHTHSALPIVTGFIGSTQHNETSTLGRGGSDYTAAIIGAALHVKMIEIWTDVDGVMTTDPKKEKYAFPLARMSYKEAMEMSYFGAKVIHPPTITPALDLKIPLKIKNTFHPDAPGTLISSEPSSIDSLICGISSIDNAALLSLQGTGLIGVCGMAKRLFGALSERKINIILISQGSSEYSICFAIAPSFVEAAKDAIEKEFALEMRTGIIDEVVIIRNQSVIAAIGEHMSTTYGISGKLFSALGNNAINVVAVAQGSSALNISLVVKKEDEVKAINAIHEAFFLSPLTTLHLFLVGTGLIGRTLLKELEKHSKILKEKHALDIQLTGVANSQRMLFNREGIPLTQVESLLDQAPDKMDINHFIQTMKAFNKINTVFVDCTSSQAIADAYAAILSANIAIVTPNKKANSGKFETYKALQTIASTRNVKFLYGSNVGAGLPIISTLNELLYNGDKILKIEAVLSGTMNYIFNAFVAHTHFSDVVKEAQAKGYTEPDPREDLNGLDFARKLLILARECGYAAEMEDIHVEPFLPHECFTAPALEDFYALLKKSEITLAQLRDQAHKENKLLRYMATFENGKGHIALRIIGPEHPFYHLPGNDNMIAITSEFYRENPLLIKGQGAGAAVTAGKVFGDIIRLGLSHVNPKRRR